VARRLIPCTLLALLAAAAFPCAAQVDLPADVARFGAALAAGDTAAALSLAEKMRRAYPTKIEGHECLARALSAADRNDRALLVLDAASCLAPDSAELWLCLGTIARAASDQYLADAAFWRGRQCEGADRLEFPATDAPAWWSSYNAAAKFADRDYPAYAAAEFRKVTSDPDTPADMRPWALLGLGDCLVRTGQAEDGFNSLLEGVRAAHDDGASIFAGHVALRHHRWEQAVAALKDAGEDPVGPPSAAPALCLAYLGAHQPSEAVQVLLGAFAFPPQDNMTVDDIAAGRYGLTQALQSLSRSAEAKQALSAAVSEPGRGPWAGALVGFCDVLAGDGLKGLAEIRQALADAPDQTRIRERLVAALRLMDRHEDALAAAGGPIADLPDVLRLAALEALSYLGRLSEAEEGWRAWTAERPGEIGLVVRRAQVLSELGHCASAADLLDTAVARDEDPDAGLRDWAAYIRSLDVPAGGRPAPAAPPERLRTVTVRAAADEEFRYTPDWRREIRGLFDRISPIFEGRAGVRFEVTDLVEWDSRDRAWDLGELHSELVREVRRDRADLVVGFSAQPPGEAEVAGNDVAMGEAALLAQHAVIRWDREGSACPDMRLLQLAHELGHILGAHHVDRGDTLMRSQMAGPPVLDFDDDNARVIELARDCDFDAGLLSLSTEARQALIAALREETQLRPEAAETWADLAMFLSELSDPGALDPAREAVALAPNDPRWRTLYADLLAEDHQDDEAGREYDALIPFVEQQGDPDAMRSLGRSLALADRPEDAAELLKRTVDITANDGWYMIDYAATLYHGGETELALTVIAQAIAAEPDDPFLRDAAAGAYADCELWEDALREAHTATEMGPTGPAHWEALGDVLALKKDRSDAVQAFLKAAELAPDYAEPLNGAAWTLFEDGRAAEGEPYVRRCLALEPNDGPALDTLGHIMNALERPADALKAFERALELMPREPASWYGKGVALEKLGRTDEALECYRTAVREDEPDGEWRTKAEERLAALAPARPE